MTDARVNCNFFSSQILAARATSIYANLLEQEKAFT